MQLVLRIFGAMVLAVVLLAACGDMAEAYTTLQMSPKPMIFMPFDMGEEWHCPQGNNGTFTHRGKYAYAYDFDMVDTTDSSANKAFGKNVYSPVNGYVVSAVNYVRDFTCNSSSCNGGWGNTVVIKPDGADYYVRLNHLKYGSVPSHFNIGRSGGSPVRVEQGDLVGHVGSTGISTHPHLDISLVTDYNTSNYQTIEFDFVEGPIRQYSKVEAELEPKKYVLDNTGRTNVGSPLDVLGIFINGSDWYSSVATSVNQAHGDNYYFNNSSSIGEWFYWAFQLNGDGKMADIRANCYWHGGRSQEVVYGLNRPYGSSTLRRTIDQRVGGYPYASVFRPYLYAYQTYGLWVYKNDVGSMCVDSMVVYLD